MTTTTVDIVACYSTMSGPFGNLYLSSFYVPAGTGEIVVYWLNRYTETCYYRLEQTDQYSNDLFPSF